MMRVEVAVHVEEKNHILKSVLPLEGGASGSGSDRIVQADLHISNLQGGTGVRVNLRHTRHPSPFVPVLLSFAAPAFLAFLSTLGLILAFSIY